MTTPIANSGRLESPTYLAFIRSQPCFFCFDAAPSSAHHWPTKGSLGTTRDDKTIPVCPIDHRRCHGETVVDPLSGARLGPIAPTEQTRATAIVWQRFWNSAPVDDLVTVAREMFALRSGGQEVAF